jgi:lipopolysaccharide/colanic/teichoic acid biosynthesis glycosyltransferase
MYRYLKRALDFLFASALIIVSLPFQVTIFFGCVFSTRSNGIYRQKRIGMNNQEFIIYKFKSMKDKAQSNDFQTSIGDPRITGFGKLIRRTKLDELPQLFNIIRGQMSFVGPRPDVSGYAEKLSENMYYLDKVKPGITSPASIFFRNEEIILNRVGNKKHYNDNVIWPLKAKMNREYADTFSFLSDLICLLQTIGFLKSRKFNPNE